jgi:hypothetical protein
MKARLWLACAAAAGLLLATPLAAQAQDAPDKNEILTLGDGPPTGKQLSREQLRHCLQMQPRLKTEGDRATRAHNELQSIKAEFDRLESELRSERAGLDTSDKAAVDAYNAKLAKRRELVAEYNAKLPAANEEAQRYNTLQEDWKTGCEDRPYSEADYASIPYRK